MDAVIYFFMGLVKDPIQGRWLASGFVALAIFFLSIALFFLFSSFFNPIRKRLDNINDHSKKSDYLTQSIIKLGKGFTKKDTKLSYNKQRLMYAGFHSPNSLPQFFGIRIMLMLALPVFCSYLAIQFTEFSVRSVAMVAVVAFILGYIIPSIYLDSAVAKRQKLVRNGFPDVIDQLIVCTEAGLGIEAGLQRVGRNIEISNEVMGYEIGLVNAELRAGVERQSAFNNLVLRTGVEEIRGFVSALAQSMRFGTNIADTMRIFADDLRDRRMQKAEEEAAKIGVKMMFPLVFCFFPGIFVVILAPAVIVISTKLL